MSIKVKLPASLVQDAKYASEISKRSISEQIEHWAHLGKAVDENPDLPIQLIQDILASKVEIDQSKLAKFCFG
jgi:hypothetical protein